MQQGSGRPPVVQTGARRVPVIVRKRQGRAPGGASRTRTFIVRQNGRQVPVIVQSSEGRRVPVILQGSGARVPVVFQNKQETFPVVIQSNGERIPVVFQVTAGRVPAVRGKAETLPTVSSDKEESQTTHQGEARESTVIQGK